jgi:hypothetical protein
MRSKWCIWWDLSRWNAYNFSVLFAAVCGAETAEHWKKTESVHVFLFNNCLPLRSILDVLENLERDQREARQTERSKWCIWWDLSCWNVYNFSLLFAAACGAETAGHRKKTKSVPVFLSNNCLPLRSILDVLENLEHDRREARLTH